MAQKAKITNVSSKAGAAIEVLLNPTDYTLTKGAMYTEVPIPGLSTPILQFIRGSGETLKLELLLDGTDGHAVAPRLTALRALVAIDGTLHTPPVVLFEWGDQSFQGVVTQLEEKMTVFNPDGNVLRSRVTLTLKKYESVDSQISATRKSSPDRTHIRVVREGETLAHIAFEAYGDPALWSVIAQHNNIDRPRFVSPGAALLVPAIPSGVS